MFEAISFLYGKVYSLHGMLCVCVHVHFLGRDSITFTRFSKGSVTPKRLKTSDQGCTKYFLEDSVMHLSHPGFFLLMEGTVL